MAAAVFALLGALGVCNDRSPNCYVWMLDGQCQTNAEYMNKNCPLSCTPRLCLNSKYYTDLKAEMKALHEAETLVTGGPAVIDQGLGFSVDLMPAEDTLVGWRAKPHTGVIDLDARVRQSRCTHVSRARPSHPPLSPHAVPGTPRPPPKNRRIDTPLGRSETTGSRTPRHPP